MTFNNGQYEPSIIVNPRASIASVHHTPANTHLCEALYQGLPYTRSWEQMQACMHGSMHARKPMCGRKCSCSCSCTTIAPCRVPRLHAPALRAGMESLARAPCSPRRHVTLVRRKMRVRARHRRTVVQCPVGKNPPSPHHIFREISGFKMGSYSRRPKILGLNWGGAFSTHE